MSLLSFKGERGDIWAGGRFVAALTSWSLGVTQDTWTVNATLGEHDANLLDRATTLDVRLHMRAGSDQRPIAWRWRRMSIVSHSDIGLIVSTTGDREIIDEQEE